ncbi:hypothetical protein JHK84_039615 [Glycine max]|nr:hypothetical protein JHK84_039615 [Glycine max]
MVGDVGSRSTQVGFSGPMSGPRVARKAQGSRTKRRTSFGEEAEEVNGGGLLDGEHGCFDGDGGGLSNRIGGVLLLKRGLTRFVKWPKNIHIQHKKCILKQRLKVPPVLNQFTKTLPKNLDKR